MKAAWRRRGSSLRRRASERRSPSAEHARPPVPFIGLRARLAAPHGGLCLPAVHSRAVRGDARTEVGNRCGQVFVHLIRAWAGGPVRELSPAPVDPSSRSPASGNAQCMCVLAAGCRENCSPMRINSQAGWLPPSKRVSACRPDCNPAPHAPRAALARPWRILLPPLLSDVRAYCVPCCLHRTRFHQTRNFADLAAASSRPASAAGPGGASAFQSVGVPHAFVTGAPRRSARRCLCCCPVFLFWCSADFCLSPGFPAARLFVHTVAYRLRIGYQSM